jgi:hypothetical protein
MFPVKIWRRFILLEIYKRGSHFTVEENMERVRVQWRWVCGMLFVLNIARHGIVLAHYVIVINEATNLTITKDGNDAHMWGHKSIFTLSCYTSLEHSSIDCRSVHDKERSQDWIPGTFYLIIIPTFCRRIFFRSRRWSANSTFSLGILSMIWTFTSYYLKTNNFDIRLWWRLGENINSR